MSVPNMDTVSGFGSETTHATLAMSVKPTAPVRRGTQGEVMKALVFFGALALGLIVASNIHLAWFRLNQALDQVFNSLPF